MRLLKHKYNTDVAILVLKKYYIPQGDRYKVKVRWINIVNPDNLYDTGVAETLTIPREVFHKDWELYENPRVSNPST